MKFFKAYKTPILATALVSALGGGYVYAHAKDGDGPGYGKRGHCAHGERGHRGHRWGDHGAKADKHIEGVLAFIETELKVTDAQQPAWQQFSKTMRELADEREAFRQSHSEGRKPMNDLPLVDRLDHRATRVDQRATQMRKMVDAVKTFYATLSPEQQRMVDEFRPGRRF